jgi:polyribonucleotide nucleotidyltransferase
MGINDKINEVLGIPTVDNIKNLPEKKSIPAVPRLEDKNKEDVENDYKYSRENYYNLIERGQDAIQGILDIANESQHPRAYEVAGNLIKQVADTVDKLQDLQGKLKSLKDVPNKTNTNIKQALFVGSSKELHSLLKNKNKDVQSDEDKSFKGKTITPTETDISDK